MSVTVSAMRAPHRLIAKAPAAVPATARILLGLLFLMSGVSGFVLLFVGAPPPQTGLAGQFQEVFFRSHWVQFVDGVQMISALLLLSNRYVTLALVLLGAVIVNILTFHLTMQPQTIGVPIIVLALWIVLAYHHRSSLSPLFTK